MMNNIPSMKKVFVIRESSPKKKYSEMSSDERRAFRIALAKKFPEIPGEDGEERAVRQDKFYKQHLKSDTPISWEENGIEYDINACIFPTEHFEPEENGLKKNDFKELAGDPRFAHSSIFRDDDGPNSLMYNPKHWKPVTDFETEKENEYFYATDTGGKMALKALTSAAKKVLTAPSIKEVNKENLESHDARATRHKHGAN